MGKASVAPGSWLSRATRVTLGMVCVGLVASCFREVDLPELVALLTSLGPAALLLFVPTIFALVSESLGWRFALAAVGSRVSIVPLFLVRGATEALSTFLPGGALVGESAKPALLTRLAGIPVPLGVSTTAYRKFLRVLSHGLFIVVVAFVGAATLEKWSERTLGNSWAPGLLAGLGGLLMLASLLSLFSLRSGRVAERVHGWALSLLPQRAHPWLEEKRAGFSATDDSTRRFFCLPFGVAAVPLGLCALAWLFESLEAYVLLRLLGQDVSLEAVLAIDVGVSLLRQLLVFLPGGIGVQEVGYLRGLGRLGLTEPVLVASAFLLLKRGREVLLGGLFLLVFGARSSSASPEGSFAAAIP